ncbi:NADH-quinone oxidoreductase subunit NuoK [Symbiobacterium thermophilum]|uniref:NADH-quinone oxidoreductase subunit K 2 n=2 Tax=Symbiobacterium thermophilum TaxID=2734 RepID=NUOK2_SYMTH|nr:NADH-quinone oxidoreductase subunit NuoK [Symbiobacterium thermophilum]Q67KP3.1 RecName: Full=NADH-quinone oxidoreductase subunit K 2; AltName: Full=NADH dehydrogenase I subunit K 2; AltName: Full=NDH-1 subunit K 2 [Symbiobacterium thermophilum IAM 14863]MBY6275895.1 NADH-quinone oxidoreductase subunit K 2 [Symbiobacterium thermophilum]BAD41755.1 NADH dehydrogenase I subunit K [Symbiobacterium thermophilum IAM 14863]
MELPIYYPLGLGALLFGLGLWGALTQKNAVRILMFIEIMLNGVNLNLITFSRYYWQTSPEMAARAPILTLFVMTVAAAEASVGLAIILAMVRNRGVVEVDKATLLKG